MAIVINGSGTVTGLAVGGLPDGTVDAGTLATDSVTAAKLEASAITGADLPAGTVLQTIVSASQTSAITTTSTSFTSGSNNCSLTITPTSTSSKILLSCSFSGGMNVADKRGYWTWFRDSTNLGDPNNGLKTHEIQGTGNYSIENPTTVNWVDSPNTTSSITYTLQFKVETGTLYFSQRGYAQSYAMEIAG
jgi:hypothetical protein